MATFPNYNPVFSANKTDITNTRTVQFGDGYQQRFTFGINQKAKQWSLTFNENNTDTAIIETFLEARKVDGASFDWSPPDESTTYKWVCPSFTKEIFDFNRNRINVTFIQVFEP